MKRILAATAALLALSACGSQDPPTAADPTTSSPPLATSSKPAPTGPAVPTMPAAASANTRAGAVAFARYFWDVVNYSQKTLQTGLLRRLGSRSCRGCQGGVQWIDGIAANKGSIRGGMNHVLHVGIPSPARPSHPDWNLSLEIRSSPQVVTEHGKTPKRYDAGTNHVSMTLRMASGTWKVEFLEYQ